MSILSEVAKHDMINYTNIDLNLAINELASMQEVGASAVRINLTPEMVPIVKIDEGKDYKDTYCIDGQCFKRMLDDNSLTVSDGIDALFNQIQKDPNCEIETTCEMAVLLNEEDTSALYEKIVEDTQRIFPGTRAIQEHINFIKSIQDTGCKVYFC